MLTAGHPAAAGIGNHISSRVVLAARLIRPVAEAMDKPAVEVKFPAHFNGIRRRITKVCNMQKRDR
jgi:hypothetical protein